MSHRNNITFIFKTQDIFEAVMVKLPGAEEREAKAKQHHEETRPQSTYYGDYGLRELQMWKVALAGDVQRNPHRMVKLGMEDITYFGLDPSKVQSTDGTRARKQ